MLKKLKLITEVNLDEYIKFIDTVKANMSNPEWLGDFSKEDLEFLLNNGSRIFMYRNDKDIVCSCMIIPATKKDLDKFEIDLDYKDVMDYGPEAVNPSYIGNKLQFQMLEELDKFCRENGYIYALSTVHPDNSYSIHNLEKDGFIKSGEKVLSRGPRNVYLKKL